MATTGILAVTLAGQHEGEDIRMREERIARLLDDPETLRELRHQRAERKAERQQQSKGRYQSLRHEHVAPCRPAVLVQGRPAYLHTRHSSVTR